MLATWKWFNKPSTKIIFWLICAVIWALGCLTKEATFTSVLVVWWSGVSAGINYEKWSRS